MLSCRYIGQLYTIRRLLSGMSRAWFRNSITDSVNDLSGIPLFACINLIQCLICNSNSFKPSEISHSYQMDGYWLVFYIYI